jgi:hypothetical protein
MSVWKGNTTVNVQTNPFSRATVLTYFIITNKSNSANAVVNLTISKALFPGSQDINISPLNMQLSIGEAFTGDSIQVLGGEWITLTVVSGNVDYYFSFNP